ncbi:MAG: hypothetical protein JJ921_01730 [Pseudomonadales bacterium]|nr:hypothetical protein [Pseudomonadales bacterium]MBO6594526.1 hypothetical protein [Pseudomonadales bacterium]MBO6701029.1 hypothetical protein [Pseudomonadales bacterium]MBO6821913.1 hypothetical protein [Pseudomonadales bacterium]MBO7005758.1 hypothetical protein [Pseudomonadales bacterium]
MVTSFITALFVTGAAGGFTADLLIFSITFWTLLFFSSGPSRALCACKPDVGFSCALPLCCYFVAAKEAVKAQPSR